MNIYRKIERSRASRHRRRLERPVAPVLVAAAKPGVVFVPPENPVLWLRFCHRCGAAAVAATLDDRRYVCGKHLQMNVDWHPTPQKP